MKMNKIIDNLWLSGPPDMLTAITEFDLIVLLSNKHQFEGHDDPRIWRAPLITGTGQWLSTLTVTANLVADTLGQKKRVLVTCSAGRNRSGAVAAFVLKQQGMSSEESIATVRAACATALQDSNLLKAILQYSKHL